MTNQNLSIKIHTIPFFGSSSVFFEVLWRCESPTQQRCQHSFALISGDAQSQLATAQEKERAATERSIDLSSRVASLESQVANYRQEKSRIEAEFELEKAKLEELEDFKSRSEIEFILSI